MDKCIMQFNTRKDFGLTELTEEDLSFIRCSEAALQRCFYENVFKNMQQIYRRTPMPKCDFNKVPKQLYWNHTSEWVFFCKFSVYFQDTFS